MSDYRKLKRLAQRVIDIEARDGDEPIGEAWDEFGAVATPSVVLALIAENEHQLCEIKGLRHGWYSDECCNIRFWPEEMEEAHKEIEKLEHERDQIKAEIAG
ncbi:hypothetical protein ACOI7N_13630, partial [Pseudomonas sp. P2758]